MFFLILILSISSGFSQTGSTAAADAKIYKEVIENAQAKATTTLKEKEIDAHLMDLFEDNEVTNAEGETVRSPFVDDKNKCDPPGVEQADKNQQEINECIAKAFDTRLKGMSDEEAKQLGQTLNLKNFGLIERNNKAQVTDYLGDRLNKSLFGEDYKKRREGAIDNDMNTFKEGERFVAHGNFYDIYESQVNKQMITELSAYCLESFKTTLDGSTFAKNDSIPLEFSDETMLACPDLRKKTFRATEIKYDPKKIKNDENATDQHLKNQLNQEQCITKYTHQICLTVGIKGMCDYYKSKLAIDLNDEKKQKLEAQLEENTNPTIQNDIAGSRACALMNRMRSYKKVAETIKVTREDLKSMKGDNEIGFKGEDFYGDGSYLGDGKKGDKISEITNIASKSVAKNYNDIEGQHTEFLKECEKGDEGNCEKYYDKNEYDNLLKAKLDHNATTAVKARQIKNLNTDEMKKFAETEGYQEALNECENDATAASVGQCVANVFKAERLAIIKQIEDRIKAVAHKKDETDETIIQLKVDKRREYFLDEGDRIERIYQYNNVVSSYLDVKFIDPVTGEKTAAGSNKEAFENEKTEYDKSDDADAKYFQHVTAFHEPQGNSNDGGRQPSSNDNERDTINIGMIDTILGVISADEEESDPSN